MQRALHPVMTFSWSFPRPQYIEGEKINRRFVYCFQKFGLRSLRCRLSLAVPGPTGFAPPNLYHCRPWLLPLNRIGRPPRLRNIRTPPEWTTRGITRTARCASVGRWLVEKHEKIGLISDLRWKKCRIVSRTVENAANVTRNKVHQVDDFIAIS